MLKTATIALAAMIAIPMASAAPVKHVSNSKTVIVTPAKKVVKKQVVVVKTPVRARRGVVVRRTYATPVRHTTAIGQTARVIRALDLIEDVIDRSVDNGPADRREDRRDSRNYRR